MSEHTINGGNFIPGTQEGDPGKLKYLHDANWQGKTMVGTSKLNVDRRACPGCMFPDAPEGKWPHTYDARCRAHSCDGSGLYKHGLGAGGFCTCPAGRKAQAEHLAKAHCAGAPHVEGCLHA